MSCPVPRLPREHRQRLMVREEITPTLMVLALCLQWLTGYSMGPDSELAAAVQQVRDAIVDV